MSTAVHSSKKNFGDLTPNLTHGLEDPQIFLIRCVNFKCSRGTLIFTSFYSNLQYRNFMRNKEDSSLIHFRMIFYTMA
jgi:hypothetical protein